MPKLLSAYISCRKRKRNTINALKFEQNLEKNLVELQQKFINKTYCPGTSICFAVTKPKLREIFAADFTDRVAHHLLVNEIEEYFEHRFIYHSYACRINKGTHLAASNLQKAMLKITCNKTQPAYFGQFDVKSFFTSIDKPVLFNMLSQEIQKMKRSKLWQQEIQYLLQTVIFHNPADNYKTKGNLSLFDDIPPHKSLFHTTKTRGLPIGNLTSQFFANVYLNRLDQYVKRVLKINYYFRYADDFVVLSADKSQICKWREQINFFLQEKLKLKLHPQKDKYGSVYQGIDFVGYFVKPDYMLCRKRIVNALKQKLYYFNQNENADPKIMIQTVNSYFGHFRQGDCFQLRQNIYHRRAQKLKKYAKPAPKYTHLTLR